MLKLEHSLEPCFRFVTDEALGDDFVRFILGISVIKTRGGGGGFFLASEILGECSIIHSPPALFYFYFHFYLFLFI